MNMVSNNLLNFLIIYFKVISKYHPEPFYFCDVLPLFCCLLLKFQPLCPSFFCLFQFCKVQSSKWKS